jgi:hypothetical protein
MTVQELINKLQKVKNKDLEVVVRGTDPTDYEYNNEVESCGVEKVYLDEEDEKETKVFVIDGGVF